MNEATAPLPIPAGSNASTSKCLECKLRLASEELESYAECVFCGHVFCLECATRTGLWRGGHTDFVCSNCYDSDYDDDSSDSDYTPSDDDDGLLHPNQL